MKTNEKILKDKIIDELKILASFSRNDINKGLESPHLACLLFRKQAEGILRATDIIFETGNHEIKELVNELIMSLDPNWKEHAQKRWAKRPADINI